MNKQKFIELLREPSSITKDEISGLENVIRQYPYFQSAHLLLAKGSKIAKDPNFKKRVSSAAVYSTDRILLKKYISGDMIFLDSVDKPPINVNEVLPDKKVKPVAKVVKSQKPTASEVENSVSEQVKDSSVDTSAPASDFNPDFILDEIKEGLESYKANKKHFEEYLQSDEEEKAVNDALSKAVSNVEETAEVIDEPEEVETLEVQEPKNEVEAPNLKETEAEEPENEAVTAELKETVVEESKDESVTPELEKAKVEESLDKVISPDFEEDLTEENEVPQIEDDVEKIQEAIDLEPSLEETTATIDKADDTEEFDISGIIEEIKNDEATEDSSAKVEESPSPAKPYYSNKIVISGSNRSKEKKKSPEESSEAKSSPKKEKPAAKIKKQPIEKAPEPTEVNEVKESTTVSVPTDEPVAEAKTEPLETTPETKVADQTADDVDEVTNSSQETESDEERGGLIHREEQKGTAEDDSLSPGALRKAKMKRLKMQKEIIDDFIDTTPEMPAPKRSVSEGEEDDSQDLSAESQVAEDEVISENMAIIYKNQGKTQKAVDIYNKLILKFPEKEAYFAARIKELN